LMSSGFMIGLSCETKKTRAVHAIPRGRPRLCGFGWLLKLEET